MVESNTPLKEGMIGHGQEVEDKITKELEVYK